MSACMSGTRGSGVLPSKCDVLEMSVVRGVGGVCDMCMCLARGGVGGEGGEWMRELGLGFTNPVGTGGVLDMCLCFGCGVLCICVLCLADTCTSEVHPVFNPVAPYGYLLSDMYLFMADITNPDLFV